MKTIHPEVGYGLQESVLDSSPFPLSTGLIGLKICAKSISVSKSQAFFSWSLAATVCSTSECSQKIPHKAYVIL